MAQHICCILHKRMVHTTFNHEFSMLEDGERRLFSLLKQRDKMNQSFVGCAVNKYTVPLSLFLWFFIAEMLTARLLVRENWRHVEPVEYLESPELNMSWN